MLVYFIPTTDAGPGVEVKPSRRNLYLYNNFVYFIPMMLVQVWKQFEFWCEGVLFSSLGLFGLVSNLASIVTFLSAEMRKQVPPHFST